MDATASFFLRHLGTGPSMLESCAGDLCQCSLGAKIFRKEGKLLSLTLRGTVLFAAANQAGFVVLPFLYATRICVHGCVLWSEPLGGFSRGVCEGFPDLTSVEEALLPGFPRRLLWDWATAWQARFLTCWRLRSSPSHVDHSPHGTARSLAAGLGRLIEWLGQERASARWKLQSFVTWFWKWHPITFTAFLWKRQETGSSLHLRRGNCTKELD